MLESMMRAAVHDRYGPPDVVSLRRVARPEPRDDELLVRIVASTVNRTDCGFRAASPPVVRLVAGLRRPRRTILGSDFAGVVEAVGPAVSRFAAGDAVFGFDDSRFGGHAEYRTIREDRGLAPIPAGIGHADAVACVEGAHYAQTYLERARLSEGQSVLIYGATGAIGSAAVQLARARGARVTAVGTEERFDLLRELGAEQVIDHRTEDFTAGERRYELVFDAVGKTSYPACRGVLADGGMFLSSELGPRLQNLYLSLLTPVAGPHRVAFPIPRHVRRHVERLAELLAAGEFRPVIDRRYPLEEIVEAYRYVETGQKTGSVVLEVAAA